MVRLILEENGERRAFKLHEGKLTIGSGEGCSLTLQSQDVAEIHAELELRGDVATLIPRAGVTPPKVLGRPITKATRLPKSAEFRIGSAVFRLQPEDQPAAAAAKPGVRSTGAASDDAPREQRPRIEHRRRTIQRGIPTWMVLAIIAVIGLVSYFVGTAWLEDRAPEHDPRSSYQDALDAYKKGSLEKALEELGYIDLELADAKLKQQAAELRGKVEARHEAAKVSARNVLGTKILETQLKGYERKYLKGTDVSRAKARLFVKRCDEFRASYPQHPGLDWVKRYRDRWAAKAELSEPSDVQDVTWEVHMLTNGKPRDYTDVFALLNGVLQRSEGADRDAVLAMIDTQNAEREEYFLDRMQQARWHWEREEYGQAVEWLIQVITKIGDDEMRTQATDALLKMSDKQGQPLTMRFLGGYKRDRPWQFEALCKDPRIKAAAGEAGLL